MNYSTQELLRFPPIEGLTVRGDFEGGALSSDFGPLLLRGVDRPIGLTERWAAAFQDQRHPSYLTHPLQDWFAQRIYPLVCAYEDGNDANTLRTDPVFKLGLERLPLEAAADLASAPTGPSWRTPPPVRISTGSRWRSSSSLSPAMPTRRRSSCWTWTIPRMLPMDNRS